MRRALIGLFIIASGFAQAQDTAYVREMIDTLCSPYFFGRGYTNGGDNKAAEFLDQELRSIGLTNVARQPFQIEVNYFKDILKLEVDGEVLKTGVDYIIHPASSSIDASLDLLWVTPDVLKGKKKIKGKGKCVVLDASLKDAPEAYSNLIKSIEQNPLDAAAYILLTDEKLTWSIRNSAMGFTVFQVKKSALNADAKSATLQVSQEDGAYISQNVMGMVPGKRSDSTMVFTAHFDHLGGMGSETYIPGASDNASGTAMLLDMAKHYMKEQPEFDTWFIFFAAEEAGLLGSMYYVEHPKFPLESIRFLLNLDLMGDAKKGITAVNGRIFEEHFQQLKDVNEKLQLPMQVKARGKAANSDHYPFFLKGVPCFFIYTRGDYTHYHDVFDRPENLPLNNYSEVFRLMLAFSEAL